MALMKMASFITLFYQCGYFAGSLTPSQLMMGFFLMTWSVNANCKTPDFVFFNEIIAYQGFYATKKPTQKSERNYSYQASRRHPQQNGRVRSAGPVPTSAVRGDHEGGKGITAHTSTAVTTSGMAILRDETKLLVGEILEVILTTFNYPPLHAVRGGGYSITGHYPPLHAVRGGGYSFTVRLYVCMFVCLCVCPLRNFANI